MFAARRSTVMPLAVWATPAVSRSRLSTTGARPAATSRCDPSRRSPPSRITATPDDVRSTRAILVRPRRSTPSLFRRATTMAASSGSSLARKSATSSTVTREPSRRWAWPSSRPIGPPPITIRWPGRVRLAKIVSLVRKPASARPGIGGAVAREPVARTMRRLLMRCGPACSSVRPMKRASSFRTRTPSVSKRSTELLGAMAPITWCT